MDSGLVLNGLWKQRLECIRSERGLRRRRIELSVTCRAADGLAAPQFSRSSRLLKTNGLEKSHRPEYAGFHSVLRSVR